MSNKNFSRRVLGIFIFLALVFSLLDISKSFFDPHCLAFDLNDDSNHTFINLQQWRRILSQGEWPMMNVYNNFGTPLIGDVITYPLSPLALTHAFCPGPVAMTINRCLIAFVSLLLLFIFYHRRFPKIMSIGLGLCTFYAPGFIWHSAHHHFQLSLIILTAFFLLQERFSKTMSMASYLGLCALSIIMFMSVSLNVVLILCLLITGYQVFLSGGLKEKSLWIVLSALACGMVASLPDILLFIEAASRSMRRLAEYPVGESTGPNKLFWTPIVAAGIYCAALFREKRTREANLILWLGVVPFCIVLFSRALPTLWKEIPLLGATDVTRLTWGASIFLMLGCGGLLLRWLQLAPGWQREVSICILFIGVDAYSLPFRVDWLFGGKTIISTVLLLVGVAYGSWGIFRSGSHKMGHGAIARRMVGFIGGAVVVLYLYYGFFVVLGFSFPRICYVRGLPAFSPDGSEKYPVPQLLADIPKNSRVAYDFDTILGMDLRGAREEIFGAGARSTIMSNEDFGVGLFNKGLIKFDNYTGDYHFAPPWRAKELQQLGISYVVERQKDEDLLRRGWEQVAGKNGAFLYKNPLPTGVVYLKKADEISPVPFVVQGNGLNIQLPQSRQGDEQLVIGLLGIPGWQASIDGREAAFVEGESKFLVLTVSPQDHEVRVRYLPFPPFQILVIFLIALSIPFLVISSCLLKKS